MKVHDLSDKEVNWPMRMYNLFLKRSHASQTLGLNNYVNIYDPLRALNFPFQTVILSTVFVEFAYESQKAEEINHQDSKSEETRIAMIFHSKHKALAVIYAVPCGQASTIIGFVSDFTLTTQHWIN